MEATSNDGFGVRALTPTVAKGDEQNVG